jgi:hypothetical protein
VPYTEANAYATITYNTYLKVEDETPDEFVNWIQSTENAYVTIEN